MGAAAICDAWRDVRTPVIGMLHLPPLPGSPRYDGRPVDELAQSVLADARALEAGGVHGLMLENFGDVPFFKDQAPRETLTAMTALAAAVRGVSGLPLGINVLRNDGRSALAIAAAVGAAYIRVNVLTGATVTDQGIIEGQAAELMRYRAALRAEGIKVLADIQVKHAAPLVARPIDQEVDELIGRGLADGLIVSGWGTGAPTDPQQIAAAKSAAGETPVFVGSGVTEATAPALAQHADGFIVGTYFKHDGQLARPVDPARVEGLLSGLAT